MFPSSYIINYSVIGNIVDATGCFVPWRTQESFSMLLQTFKIQYIYKYSILRHNIAQKLNGDISTK